METVKTCMRGFHYKLATYFLESESPRTLFDFGARDPVQWQFAENLRGLVWEPANVNARSRSPEFNDSISTVNRDFKHNERVDAARAFND